jgi:hypothetical protein
MLINVCFFGGEISPVFNKEIWKKFFFSCVNLTNFSHFKKIRQNFSTKKKEKQTLMLMSSSKTTVVNSDFLLVNFGQNLA